MFLGLAGLGSFCLWFSGCSSFGLVDDQACSEQALLLVLCVYVCGSIPTCPHNTSRDCWNAVCVGMGARVHLLGCAALTLPCVIGYLECRRITLLSFRCLHAAALCANIYRLFLFLFFSLLVSHAACAFFSRGMYPRIRDVGIPPLGAPSHPWTA